MPRPDQTPDQTPRHLRPGDTAPPGTVGTGEALCPKCGGSGKIADQPCDQCEGSGIIIQGIGGA